VTLKSIIKRCLQLLFVVTVTALAWFNVAAAVIAICAIVLVAMGGRLESLVEFSFGPLKAKLEKNLTESEILIQKLREFSIIQAAEAVATRAHMNRWASEGDTDLRSITRIVDGLRATGCSDSDLQQVKWPFVEMTIKDVGMAAIGLGRIPVHLGTEATNEWQEVARERGNPDRIEGYLRKWDVLTPERFQRITDMRWMIENRDILDTDMYLRSKVAVEWPTQ
jgi:hypothetical protein